MTYLITRPEHDDTTFYLSNWCKETISLAEKKGLKVFDLSREKANKKEVESRIKKFSPRLLVFNGHGDDNTICGHKNQPIIRVGENEDLLKSKIVYAISCKSAKNLGPKSINAGTKSYTGYDDDFIFIYEPEKMSKPLSDETAKLFLEPSKLFIESLIKENNIKESSERIKDMIKKNVLKSISSNTDDPNIAKFLLWDLKHFVSHGDLDVSIKT